MQLISKFNIGFRFLLCAIDIYRKYALVISLKDKKGVAITNSFQKILDESNRKPNKIWVDKGSEFYNRSMKSWLEKNAIEMYSAHNEGKSVVAERFIKILKNKFYKYVTSVSENVYIDKLDDIVNKYSNRYHSTIKMKPVDVKSSTYIDSSKENNNKDSKFKIGDVVKISKKVCKRLLSKKKFKKLKNTVQWTHVISDLNREEIVGTFYKNELQKTNQKDFRIKKVIKRKGDKLYVKWKGYNKSFNIWIDKKDII